jgi:hypothetical protein
VDTCETYKYAKRFSGPHQAWLLILINDDGREVTTIYADQAIPKAVVEAMKAVDEELSGPWIGRSPLIFEQEHEIDLVLEQLNKK